MKGRETEIDGLRMGRFAKKRERGGLGMGVSGAEVDRGRVNL